MIDFGIYTDDKRQYIVEADTKKQEITSILLLLDNTTKSKNTFAFLDNPDDTFPVRDEDDGYCYVCKAKMPKNLEEVPKVAKEATETAVLDKIKEKAEEQAIIEEAKENTEEY